MNIGFERFSDSANTGIEKASHGSEVTDKTLSMEDLRSRLDEVLPIPSDDSGKVDESQTQDSIEQYPQKVTLDDGTVVTLPSLPNPILHDAEIGDSKAAQTSEMDASIWDDNGKPYMTDEGSYIPNNTYEIDGTVYKTDDRGEIYSADGKLYPNDIYELNGNIYTTDENGRIIDVQAKPTFAPENARDSDAQKNAGSDDRREGDQGGHIVGRDMGGDGGEGNLVAMDSKINQSDYKRMENDIKRALDDGKEVTTHTEISYSGDSNRPDIIKVTVTADGKETIYIFDNNIDGSLREKVVEVGGKDAAETVQSVLDETGSEISSVKEEYGENGNLVKVTVNVTYTDEDGKSQRTRVVIDNPQGGDN